MHNIAPFEWKTPVENGLDSGLKGCGGDILLI